MNQEMTKLCNEVIFLVKEFIAVFIILLIIGSIAIGGKARIITLCILGGLVVIYIILMILGNIGANKAWKNGKKPIRLR